MSGGPAGDAALTPAISFCNITRSLLEADLGGDLFGSSDLKSGKGLDKPQPLLLLQERLYATPLP